MTKEEYEKMKDKEYDRDNVKLVEVRYYSVLDNGYGRSESFADKKNRLYAFLLKTGDQYVNIFSGEELPVYERCKAAMGENQTQDMDFHGSKLVLAYGEEKEGLCYVVDPFSNTIFESAKVKYSEIVDYMVHSSNPFVDRKDFLFKKIVPVNHTLRVNNMCRDYYALDKFNEFLAEKGTGYQYHK